MKYYLEFERDIKELEEELEKLKDPFNKEGLSEVETDKIASIQSQIDEKLKISYANLNAWQKTQVARMEDRPKAKFFIENLFTDFISLSGDRRSAADNALISGFAKFEGMSVLVLGQEKGNDLESRLYRNFGMLNESGYRTANRLQKLAEKFNIPCITFIDTPGASPTVSSEKGGIAESIASSIECQMNLKVPVIAVIIGEGGSGGALALASANKVLMFEHSIFSVISPEGCASILWRDPSKSLESAEQMKLTSTELLRMQIIDEVIKEPIGGAHRNKEQIISSTREVLKRHLQDFQKKSREEILAQRREKFLKIGIRKPSKSFVDKTYWINPNNILGLFNEKLFKYKKVLLIVLVLILAGLLYLF